MFLLFILLLTYSCPRYYANNLPDENKDWRHIVEIEKTCECGIKNPGMRIHSSGLDFAANHAWPWMVSIVNVTDSDDIVDYCGGSLINDRYIMTAAHCIPDMNETGIENFRVYLGTNYINFNHENENYLNLGIMQIIVHPLFSFETAENDIALIRLSEKVKFTKHIRPVCFRKEEQLEAYREPLPYGVITGWGSYNLTEQTENELKEGDVELVSNEICRLNYSSVEIEVTKSMLCAKALPGRDPCKGDSGGPLVVRSSNKKYYTQIGIISHGQGCSVDNYPAIFSRVEVFLEWIATTTQGDAVYCRNAF